MFDLRTSSAIAFAVFLKLSFFLEPAGSQDLNFEMLKSDLPCDFLDSVNITGGSFDHDGTITFQNVRYPVASYARINYSYVSEEIDEENVKITRVEVDYYIRGCVCVIKKCVWVCCDNILSYKNELPYPWCEMYKPEDLSHMEVPLLDGSDSTMLLDENDFFFPWRIVDHYTSANDDEWSFNKTGYVHSVGNARINQHDYCLFPDGNVTTLYYGGEIESQLKKGSLISIFVSIPFLIVTLAIYICIPELRNIHGKSLICHVFALLCVYVLLLLTNFRLTSGWCKIQGFTLYFWLLVCFFWLNVMCFDIFWTFSSGVLIKNEKRRFLYYSLYAWGVPVLFTGAALMVEHLDAVPLHIKPRFGENEDVLNCFLQRDMAIEFIYFYFPLCIVVVSNVYFFGMTAFRIFRIQRATEAALRHDSKRHSKFEKDRYRFSLYLRLFVVMGITWTFEILSWASQSELWFFYLADICNCLLGVIIFFLFVWKQKVRQLVVKRIGRHQEPSRSKSSVNTASFTTGTTKSSSGHEAAVPMNPIATRTSELATDSA
ncbi:G-protein coupled receptor Mth2-like isoform X3 [Uranotaenia lowii]|uniref:G-protein coupled receptor Mth2-like isoform X3 n=1 Tax=Uranotaenia lowii TaxID=190385 RepID=UPI002478D41B|nr:G-protein coupled receptor Mth2-like isoform X3 [Uranotaenia lowii]